MRGRWDQSCRHELDWLSLVGRHHEGSMARCLRLEPRRRLLLELLHVLLRLDQVFVHETLLLVELILN